MITYIPINESNFMLVHSRDESVLRPIATPPIKREINGLKHVFPVDPEGKGTWIGFSEKGTVAALFNSGTHAYKHDPPYKHSRGLIIPELFSYDSFDRFYEEFDHYGLAPFTLWVIEGNRFLEIKKDPENIQLEEINPLNPKLALSKNLYPDETEDIRRLELLKLYYDKGFVSKEEILKFHDRYRFESAPDKTVDTAPHILKTVSTTCIIKSPKMIDIDYFDKINDVKITNKLKITKPENQTILQ